MSAPENFSLLAIALAVCSFWMGAVGAIGDSRNATRAAWILGALALAHALIAGWWVALA